MANRNSTAPLEPPHTPRVLRDPLSGAAREYFVTCWCGKGTRGTRFVCQGWAEHHAKKGLVKGRTYAAVPSQAEAA